MSSFGFTFLSRKALGQAEQMMLGGRAGVRDEVGFLIIHQRYADHFFPGTSVLHTRLRYALLIPWLYRSLRTKRPIPKDFARAFADLEHDLTGRLKYAEGLGGEKDGVIGGEVYPREISQPPAYVYWTALTKWGLIGPRPDGRPWSRPDMAKLLASSRQKAIHDDDGKPLDAVAWPISERFDVPDDWENWGNWGERYDKDGNGKMTLDLSPRERCYIAGKLRSVRSPSDTGEPSLLAKLVGKPLDTAHHCWDAEIVSLAGSEAPMLKRAGQAAALSAIGRAIYAALVETLKEDRDKRPQPDRHRSALKETVDKWGKQASRLDMSLFLNEIGHLPSPVEAVLKDTFAWVRADGRDPMSLLEVYARAEVSRKDDRARLAANQFGVDRRMEWQGEHHGQADPLHYRWGNVKRLLRDVEGA